MDAEFFLNPERAVQNRIIRLLQKYNGYEYIGNLKDTENTNIREDVLRKFLMERQELTSVQATEAIRKLKEVAICSNKEALYNSNKAVYNTLRYPVSLSQGVSFLSLIEVTLSKLVPRRCITFINYRTIDN